MADDPKSESKPEAKPEVKDNLVETKHKVTIGGQEVAYTVTRARNQRQSSSLLPIRKMTIPKTLNAR
jgi:hypothetical protein